MNRELNSKQYAEALAWFVYKNSENKENTETAEPKKTEQVFDTVDGVKDLFFAMAKNSKSKTKAVTKRIPK